MSRGVQSGSSLHSGRFFKGLIRFLQMINIRERNKKILRMRQEAIGRSEVARRFGLSRSRIWLIERAFKAEEALTERRNLMRAELRTADDPDKMRPVGDLLDALRWRDRYKTPLLKHLGSLGKKDMSVQELMDLAVTVIEEGGVERIKVPILRICSIGKYGLRDLLAQLREIDFGPRGSQIWQEKRAALNRHWKM
jgi:hypothetical protein